MRGNANARLLPVLAAGALMLCGAGCHNENPDPEAPGRANAEAPGPANEETTLERGYSPTGLWWDYGRYESMIEDTKGAELDSSGIPTTVLGDDRVYNPVFIAQWALQEWDYYKRGMGDEHLARAEDAASWFRSEQEDGGAIPYEFEYEVGGMGPGVSLKPTWASAMAQGELLSLLARLYEETGNDAHRLAGDAALKPLSIPVEQGGLRQELPEDKGIWFEEYPSDPPSFVLNGHQFTLIGLHDWAEVTGSQAARELYEEGLDSLVAALELFDGEERSAYHLGHLTAAQPVFGSDWYHMVNTRNLLWLSILEPENTTLADYRDRWQEYPDCQTPKGKIICFTIR